jgi:hypothetical protein
MTRVALIQSNYIPWKGYFDIMQQVDLFIFHDDLQYTKGDWRNRNQIKTPQGLQWLTVPVGTSERRLINEVALPADRAWAARHWRALRQHYEAAPFFDQYADFLSEMYARVPWQTLSELNQFLCRTIARDWLGIHPEFAQSTDFGPRGQRLERVISVLHNAGADSYVSGPAAKAYIEEAQFEAANIELIYQDYSGYPEYPQFYPPFTHTVTILDLLFHTGPAAPDYIWGWRATDKPTDQQLKREAA